jgi:hypothetical protein
MIAAVLVLTQASYPTWSDNVKVVLNGSAFEAPAHIRSNRIQVAMRPVFEKLGAHVQWYPQSRKVVARTSAKTVTMIVNEVFAYDFGDGRKVLDYPAKIVNGRIMVPLRFVTEAFGGSARWDALTRTAYIDSAEVQP